MNDVIFVIMKEYSDALSMGETVSKAIELSKQPDVPIAAMSVETMRHVLQKPDAVKLPKVARTARRKLLVGFDVEANNLIETICREIGESEAVTQRARREKLSVLPVAAIIGGYCARNNLNRVWVQKPLLGSFDERLAKRLSAYGIEVCQIDEQIEKTADECAVRTVKMAETESLKTEALWAARCFWITLKEALAKAGAQAALLNNDMSALDIQDDGSLSLPKIIDINALYTQAILTWARGDY